MKTEENLGGDGDKKKLYFEDANDQEKRRRCCRELGSIFLVILVQVSSNYDPLYYFFRPAACYPEEARWNGL